MRRILPAASAVVLLTAGEVGAIRVLAATNDLGALARAAGGDRITVDVVARPDRDPHALEVRPSTLRIARRADVYLKVGMSLDPWSDEIVRGSRNRTIRVINCSEVVTALEVPKAGVDASMGDVHPDGNPHYWLDPVNGMTIARFLARELGALDRANAEEFRANAERFAGQVESRLPGWDAAMRGTAFVEYHRTWVYLAQRFGLEIVGEVEPYPGIPPTARHLAGLAALIADRKVALVVHDVYHSPSPLELLQRETGVRIVVLPSTCTDPTVEAYLSAFDEMAVSLRATEASR